MWNVDNIYEMLDWNNPISIQEKGKELAEQISDLSVFIQPLKPKYNKNVWENCAKVLSGKSDDVLEPYLKELLEWLQDINWPGSIIILERLKLFSGSKLKCEFIESLNTAANLKNEEGIMWAYYLSKLLDNKDLKSELTK